MCLCVCVYMKDHKGNDWVCGVCVCESVRLMFHNSAHHHRRSAVMMTTDRRWWFRHVIRKKKKKKGETEKQTNKEENTEKNKEGRKEEKSWPLLLASCLLWLGIVLLLAQLLQLHDGIIVGQVLIRRRLIVRRRVVVEWQSKEGAQVDGKARGGLSRAEGGIARQGGRREVPLVVYRLKVVHVA